MELTLDSLIFAVGITLIVIYLWYIALRVVNARVTYKVDPPKTTGNKEFESIYRVQVNTFEASILYIPLFSVIFVLLGGFYAVVPILLWLIARLIFQWGYSKDIKSRTIGFKIQQIVFFLSLAMIIYGIVRFFI